MSRHGTGVECDEDVAEFEELLTQSRIRLARQRQHAVYSLALLFGAMVAIFLLSNVGPLHSSWPKFGKAAVAFFDGTLLIAVMACGSWWNGGKLQREMKRDFRELMEDRYGVKEP